MASRPWLRFWRAVAGLGRAASARNDAERAFEEFLAAGNVIGAYMAWSVALRAIALAGDDFLQLKHWLNILPSLPPVPPIPTITARVALAELIGWAYACIFEADVYARAERAFEVLNQHGSADERVFAISALAALYAFGGEGARARALVAAQRQLHFPKRVASRANVTLETHERSHRTDPSDSRLIVKPEEFARLLRSPGFHAAAVF